MSERQGKKKIHCTWYHLLYCVYVFTPLMYRLQFWYLIGLTSSISLSSAIVLGLFAFIQIFLGFTHSKLHICKKNFLKCLISVNNLRAMMLWLCWCCFLAIYVWSWLLEKVRKVHICITMINSVEKQVYSKKINYWEDNNLWGAQKKKKNKHLRQTFTVQSKQNAGKKHEVWIYDYGINGRENRIAGKLMGTIFIRNGKIIWEIYKNEGVRDLNMRRWDTNFEWALKFPSSHPRVLESSINFPVYLYTAVSATLESSVLGKLAPWKRPISPD